MADVARLAAAPQGGIRALGRFAVSHRPEDAEGWVELLASGLTFDLAGLDPAAPADLPALGAAIGMARPDPGNSFEAISLLPGAHLAGGEAILPILRVHVGLAALLSSLAGVAAVAWHPARTWVEPQAFIRMVAAWLEGGAFPALGLTALVRSDTGETASEGLAFFVGRELLIPPGIVAQGPDTAKLAIRLIHHIVEAGLDDALGPIVTAEGQRLCLEESDDGRFVEVRRSAT